MTTVTADELTETIQSLKDETETALEQQDLEQFIALEKYVSQVESYVRELQQSMWASEATQTIRKLEKGETLDECDQDLLRVFLISDAEHYLSVENNFNEWLTELRRLANDLARRAQTVDRHTIAELRGVLKDAMRLVPDIRNFLDEQQRVVRFKQAMTNLDDQSRKLLVKLLKEQLHSPNR
jgi:hypothetical protein